MQIHYVSAAMADVHGRAGVTLGMDSPALFMPAVHKVAVMSVYAMLKLIAHRPCIRTIFPWSRI